MRLIDADALKEELRNSWVRKAKMPLEADPFLAFAMSDIDHAPTIDAEPVVRCKDCRYFKEWIIDFTGDTVELNACSYNNYGTNKDGYCNRGERREP